MLLSKGRDTYIYNYIYLFLLPEASKNIVLIIFVVSLLITEPKVNLEEMKSL